MKVKYIIAIYIRLSMEDLNLAAEGKDESLSVSNQRNYICNYIKNHKEFADADLQEFVDDGYSGTNFDRPEIQRLLSLCRRGEINCIIVKDLSRFGRNYLEVGDYLEQIFPFLGIRFISINDGFDSKEYIGQTSGMDIAFKNFTYEMYSKDLSRKIKSNVEVCMKRGEYHAGWIAYGYRKAKEGKGIVIDEEAARVVRRIFLEMAAGKDAKTLAQELNEEGVPTRLSYKQSKGEQLNRHYEADVWNRNKVHAIVHNEIYQGDMIYRKATRTSLGRNSKINQPKEKWIVIENHHEAIISRELFQKANDKIRKVKVPRYDRSNVKKGIVFCGCCGKRLELHKTKRPYYLCKQKDMVAESACNQLRIEKAVIEETVWNVWKLHCSLFQKQSPDKVYAKQMEQLLKKQQELNLQLNRIPLEKMRLYERFREGELASSVFLNEKEILVKKEEEVRKNYERVTSQSAELEKKAKNCESIVGFMKKYRKLEGGMDEFMREMVEKVIVYEDNRLEIVWRYGDEFGEIV